MHYKTWPFIRPDSDTRRGCGVEQVHDSTNAAISHTPRLKQENSGTTAEGRWLTSSRLERGKTATHFCKVFLKPPPHPFLLLR